MARFTESEAISMDIKAINQAIQGTPLAGRVSAEDLERWRVQDNAPHTQPPLWLSVLITMAASLNMGPDDINPILQATMPKGERLPDASKATMLIDPGVIVEPSLAAEAAMQHGDFVAAQALWIDAIKAARQARMSTAAPYRMFANVATAAFANGETRLAEAALDIALRLNPNYTFAQRLIERHLHGEFNPKQVAAPPQRAIVTARDLEMKTNDELFVMLADQGIQIDAQRFTALAKPLKATIDPLVDKMLALSSKAQTPDEDSVYAACEILWGRLIGKPVFETFERILSDLEDVEINSTLYFDCIKKLTWACKEADRSVFDYYQTFSYELSGLRYTLHGLLAYHVLQHSCVADDVLHIAERTLATGHFPDMFVADIVSRIANGKKWQHQCEQFVARYPEYSQVIVMGLMQGLLAIDQPDRVMTVGQSVWRDVLQHKLAPEEPAILLIGDSLLAACQLMNDRSAEKRVRKELRQIVAQLQEISQQEASTLKDSMRHRSYMLLRDLGMYPDIFAYETFLYSLNINFATDAPTADDIQSFAIPNRQRVGRNDPCPCGSGKKHKKCHGSVV